MKQSPVPRVGNLILGTWLCISAFIWPHTLWGQTNTWICGVLCMVFAFIGLGLPHARLLNTLLASWLFVSTWLIVGTVTGTKWNNSIVAIAVFFLSLVEARPPSQSSQEPPESEVRGAR